MFKFLTITIIFLSFSSLAAQDTYWVFLKNKKGTVFNPYEYFDQKAIERRNRQDLPLADSTDYPLNQWYVSKIHDRCISVEATSRWLNAVVVKASVDSISFIRSLPFVKKVERISSQAVITANIQEKLEEEISIHDSALLQLQTERMKASVFWENGFTGKGIRVAIFDVGFPRVNEHETFEHIRKENRIIATYDFIKDDSNVYHSHSHGTSVMSCVGGKYGDINIGLAVDAEFLLARTERFLSELKDEEYSWVEAAEWADKNGAHIINSSLGYSESRYFPEDMSGKVSYIAKAANIAASKGILIVNSAGNEGAGKWHTIVTPSDADSVMAIGGTDPYTDAAINFSSFGPAADGNLKPNVSAFGKVISASKTGYGTITGTSFASPLVAGFAACALQANLDLTVMELFELIEKSGHLYPYFDYAHGYGIPQADHFLGINDEMTSTFSVQITDSNSVEVLVDSIFVKPDTIDSDDWPRKNLFYHLLHKNGQLLKYGVLLVEEEIPLNIDLDNYVDLKAIRIHFEGYTQTHTIKSH